jgi:hypothetical protein
MQQVPMTLLIVCYDIIMYALHVILGVFINIEY